tara:strand:+ start:49 stop:711 length:663 start_codon:yes stop_codon:yes gene_type:complete
MPYCSIEEAWGKDFFENDAEPEKFKKIVSDDYNNNEDYFNNNYQDSNVYDELGDSIFCPENRINKIKKKKNFSRTYNQLSEHSGPETRLPNMNRHIIHKKNKKTNKKTKKIYEKEDELNNLTSDEETNLKTDDENDTQSNNFDNDIINEAFDNEISNNAKNKYVNNLIKENIKLKNLLKKYNKNNLEYDNIFDLILFLSFGVFVILLLDIISKSVRRITF